jgi:ADP-ribosyl-[dinitrogen reductase] hydrolase
MTADFLCNKMFGCLMGMFEGDAMGLPAECQSPLSIRNNLGYVDTMLPNKLHPFKSVASRPAGTISDDSQLTLALMDSLGRGYDLDDIKKSHVAALDSKWGKPVGWGKSTRNAVTAIKNNEWSPPTQGSGNGTVMKIAPLAIYSIMRCHTTSVGKYTNSFNASLFKKCREISELTHGDPRCTVATYCQARMIIRAFQQEFTLPLMPLAIADLFIKDAEYAESKLNVVWPQDGLLSNRMKEIMWTMTTGPFASISVGGLSPLLLDTAYVSTQICVEHSSYIMNSYPLVAYCIAKYLPSRNFMRIVCETINAGGDADSNGAMAGAIAGALLGQSRVPLPLFKQIKNHEMLLAEMSRFWRSFA